MPLTRKTRVSGKSIVVTIPSQLVEAYNINTGDLVEIIPRENGEIRIRKCSEETINGGTVT
jgi:bifunctional DNA-binding transcriptional regulator/antitoxin component of YhaV-PrlF toxin-antitoxin module